MTRKRTINGIGQRRRGPDLSSETAATENKKSRHRWTHMKHHALSADRDMNRPRPFLPPFFTLPRRSPSVSLFTRHTRQKVCCRRSRQRRLRWTHMKHHALSADRNMNCPWPFLSPFFTPPSPPCVSPVSTHWKVLCCHSCSIFVVEKKGGCDGFVPTITYRRSYAPPIFVIETLQPRLSMVRN
jgi:hypothetical protein